MVQLIRSLRQESQAASHFQEEKIGVTTITDRVDGDEKPGDRHSRAMISYAVFEHVSL